jgi:hypothetical protein
MDRVLALQPQESANANEEAKKAPQIKPTPCLRQRCTRRIWDEVGSFQAIPVAPGKDTGRRGMSPPDRELQQTLRPVIGAPPKGPATDPH